MHEINLVVGTVFTVKFPCFIGSWKKPKYSHDATVKCVVLKESYGIKTAQHTFRLEVVETDDSGYPVGHVFSKMGRNLYPNILEVHQQPSDYEERAEEKRERGNGAKFGRKMNRLLDSNPIEYERIMQSI